ncbi:CHAT domain-containing protein [Streptomyces sp. NPDC059752]|uniref:CHAT domain-containing protein n=1 Tax=unclassified Streptomyces TaxID=2593676 RepID=UPI003651164A
MDLVVWAAIAAADLDRRVGMPRLRAALALRRAPMARVSGDQASRRNHLEEAVGLTRSLLRGGVRRTVVSLWPVDDWVTPLLIARFYAGLADRLAPAYALAQAQRTLHGISSGQMQAAYTALGGDPEANADGRSGLDPDPRLRDTEETPEPLGGDAERYWAPFVLVE